jgi:hypothetical protein
VPSRFPRAFAAARAVLVRSEIAAGSPITAPTFYCRMFAPSRSLCCSNRRRFDSSSQSTLWASNVFAPAALNRTMRPFFLCTKRRASATCSSTRRRSSSKLFASGRTSPEHQYQHAGKSTGDQHQRRRAGVCNVDCGERQGGGRVFPAGGLEITRICTCICARSRSTQT